MNDSNNESGSLGSNESINSVVLSKKSVAGLVFVVGIVILFLIYFVFTDIKDIDITTDKQLDKSVVDENLIKQISVFTHAVNQTTCKPSTTTNPDT